MSVVLLLTMLLRQTSLYSVHVHTVYMVLCMTAVSINILFSRRRGSLPFLLQTDFTAQKDAFTYTCV